MAQAKKTGVKRNTVVNQMEVYKEEVEEEKLYKVKLYIYPQWKSPIAIFDEDELQNQDAMMVLCARQ